MEELNIKARDYGQTLGHIPNGLQLNTWAIGPKWWCNTKIDAECPTVLTITIYS
jgi:hypothetical protein